ncbi:MAG: ABC transporter substrate-binding protein [Afipia sp.]|nr:ABC transporter substrate-binding protein [Afipia sp.]OJW65414.1 MAG: nitrate ABC transporter substrate-binding protein [Afipia sp. 64-13]
MKTHHRMWRTLRAAAVAVTSAAMMAALGSAPARAEASEVTIAKQYGLLFLPLIIMEQNKLMEKQAEKAGLPNLKVNWQRMTGGNVMNEALISGNLDFASGGVPPFIILWGKTQGNLDVRAVAAMDSLPIYLNTRDPKVKSIKDFGDNNRIAMPAAKISIQAIMLQMAAAKEWGIEHAQRLDKNGVTLAHPEAMSSMLSNMGNIDSHFASPPYNFQELTKPGIHKVLDSYDVLGPATCEVVWTTAKFRQNNPTIYKAFLAAFQEAIDLINNDKKQAAEIYVKSTNNKESLEDTLAIINHPHTEYTTTPKNIMKYATFMNQIGLVKSVPKDWKELFFPEVHNLPGS